jgi:hypothetical protein
MAVGVPAEATRSTANPLGPFENNNSRRACRCRHDFADDVQISLPILNRERRKKIKTFSSFFLFIFIAFLWKKHLKVAPIDVIGRAIYILICMSGGTHADGGEQRRNDLEWRLSDAVIL